MIRRGRSDTRGQALVEFALVAPIFFLMLFALIDFGRYVYYVQILNNAAREGARYAIVHGSNGLPSSGPPAPGTTSSDQPGANVRSTVRNYLVGVIAQGTALTTNLCWRSPLDSPCTGGSPSPGDNSRGNLVDVNVEYQFRSVIPIVPIPPITVQGASTLVINN